MRLIDADALMVYCSNQKAKTISNNDIARFPTADTVSREEYDKLQHDYNELYDITNGLLDRLLGLNHWSNEKW